MKVYEALADAFRREGVERIFVLLGDGNMEWVAAFAGDDRSSVVHARHEGPAVTMAEGYARATGRVGVASTTMGPGLTNAMTALSVAARSKTPVVVYVGDTAAGDHANLQYIDQEAVVRATGAHFLRADSPGAIAELAREAFYLAQARRMPVVLDVPIDVQDAEYPGPWMYEPSRDDLVGLQRVRPSPESVEAACELISSSTMPLVLAGRGAVASVAPSEVLAFAERIDALTGVTLPARGWLRDDPYYLGIVGLFSSHVATELLGSVDCVIGLGASLNYYTTEGGYLFPNASFVQVDLAYEARTGTGRRADSYVVGDVRSALQAFTDALKPAERGSRARTPDVAAALTNQTSDHIRRPFDIEPGTADPRLLCEALDEVLPDDVGLVIGAGHFWSFPVMHMHRWRTPFHYTLDFGSIGQGLAAAIGVASSDPRRPIALVEGDGSVMMHIQELETAARYALPLCVIVLNDHALGAEYHKLAARGLDSELGVMPDTDLAAVAASLGCRAATVRSPEELRAAVRDFLGGDGPMLIDAIVSKTVISMPYWRTQYGRE